MFGLQVVNCAVRFSGMDRDLGGTFDRGACRWCWWLLVHRTTSTGACSRSPVVVAPSFDKDVPHERKGEHREVTGSDSALASLALVTSGVEICRNCLMMIRMQQKDVRIFWNVSILRIKPPIQLCFLNAKSIGLGCLEGNEVNDQCKRPCKKPGLQWIISLRLDVLKPLLNVYQLLFLARACT